MTALRIRFNAAIDVFFDLAVRMAEARISYFNRVTNPFDVFRAVDGRYVLIGAVRALAARRLKYPPELRAILGHNEEQIRGWINLAVVRPYFVV